MRAFRFLLPCLLAPAAASCVDPTEVPIGGVYRATLLSQGGEGGAVIELVGPGIQGIAAPGSVAAVHSAGDTTRVLVLADPRNIASPAPIAFDVTMAAGAGVPRATVLQVVAANNRKREFPGSYTVHFSR